MASLPDLSSRELQAICTLAECGSFVAAALTMNVSQPALTRTVQRVEQALGVALFRRSTRRVEITAAGQEFVTLAQRVLADLRISVENMREISDELRGRCIVSSVMSVAYTQLPRIVARYRESRPGIELQVREGVHGTVMDDVRSGVADMGITYIDDVPGEYSVVSLGREVFHVVMPRNHPLAARPGVKLEELAPYAQVSLPRDAQTRRLIDSHAAIAGVALRHTVTVSQFATVMQFVWAGVGVAIVPGGAVPAALSADLVARPLSRPALSQAIGVVFLKERGLTPSASGFLAQLRSDWIQAVPAKRARRR
ncbi:LysR family transcriptional regulator [Achromobacter sp. HZ01]|jgi:DNA-binding transcriptional LysR family regulator|uniref:LysR family transcriptional regulator n=1 Tax=Achromobacter sp. HZ01 TaxID=1416886 RepID=UPI000DC288BC|nr:LysR family transcriptional regulator [Achromobacter sp. HZ01]RAP63766.1 LysR family transcriptional regulator [Achromobacter sp. HZ01]